MSLDYDVVCLSHLRWDFVFQRPQHLLSRCAREHRTFFFEEPLYDLPAGSEPRLEVFQPDKNASLWRALPHLAPDTDDVTAIQRGMLREMFDTYRIGRHVVWYYTPMALPFSDELTPVASVYDAMDQLSAFKGAPPEMIENEKRLYKRVDLVFTGGHSLYEAKKHEHARVFPFPSSVDAAHFAQARRKRDESAPEPTDQSNIAQPRVGFFGVIDERFDIDLLGKVADLRPGIQFVIIGPVVKINAASLPQRANIHYLGGKSYGDLPSYLAGWDVAMMPFAMNESTRFISPTKTPEYLAAGCPVVSTPIKDVVQPYGDLGLVHIASTPEQFAEAVDAALAEDPSERIRRVDEFLSHTSWDRTWRAMSDLIQMAVESAPEAGLPKQAASEQQDRQHNDAYSHGSALGATVSGNF